MATTLDLLTLSEAKAALNLSSSTHDAEIGRFVTAVSLRIDDLSGPVVAREVEEAHDGGAWFLRPRRTPVLSVESVEEYVSTNGTTLTAESNASQPTGSYLLDVVSTHNVRIIRRNSGSDAYFPRGRRNVGLTYTAGRFVDTDAVDGKFKQAAALTLLHLWRPSAGAWTNGPSFGDEQVTLSSPVPGWMVPRAVLELLGDELRPPGVA